MPLAAHIDIKITRLDADTYTFAVGVDDRPQYLKCTMRVSRHNAEAITDLIMGAVAHACEETMHEMQLTLLEEEAEQLNLSNDQIKIE